MKEITQYVTEDGTVFPDRCGAEKYEEMASRVQAAEEKYLGLRSEQVERGVAFLQHTPESVQAFKKEICRIAADYMPDYAQQFLECGADTRHISHAESIVCEYRVKALQSAFYRLSCINNEKAREYQQPFFAQRPVAWEDMVKEINGK